MDTKTIVMCVVALILGMLMVNMLKSVCGCKTVEGAWTAAELKQKEDASADGCVFEPGVAYECDSNFRTPAQKAAAAVPPCTVFQRLWPLTPAGSC